MGVHKFGRTRWVEGFKGKERKKERGKKERINLLLVDNVAVGLGLPEYKRFNMRKEEGGVSFML